MVKEKIQLLYKSGDIKNQLVFVTDNMSHTESLKAATCLAF
jgi:hypothetical protein